MTREAHRSFAVAAVLVAAVSGLSACSAASAGSAPATHPPATHAPATSSTTVDPTSPTSTASSTQAASPPSGAAPASAPAPATAITSTPGLQLKGPQPLPSRGLVSPTRVRIPAIGVDSTLQHLQLKAGVLQPPTDPLRAGWWAGGPVPGDPGPAVIAGHLDSYTGPAVFIDLGRLRAGDVIDVTRSDSTTAVFVVDSVKTYEKAAFPTEAVYGPTPGSALRLITCGGTFDRAKQLYLANVVVFATLRG